MQLVGLAFLDDGQITHLIGIRLKHLLCDFGGGGGGGGCGFPLVFLPFFLRARICAKLLVFRFAHQKRGARNCCKVVANSKSIPDNFMETSFLNRANGRGGFGSQTAAAPRKPPESRDCGHCDGISLNANTASTFELSQCQHCKGGVGCLGRGEVFGRFPAISPPERPRPFTHYRS